MSLKDKASKVNFAGLPLVGATGDGEGGARPKTAPGAMMAFAHDQRSELLRQNDELLAQASRAGQLQTQLEDSLADLKQWDGAKATRKINPEDIRPSKFANRHASSFASVEFQALKAELKEAGGNVQPIKVRQISDEGGEGRYEIVFGHRRWEACKQLELPVLAMVDNLDDRELFAEMERENRARKDLSPWEQGVMYRRALDEGLFASNRKLAESLGVDLGAVGRALLLADLPPAVVEAFPSPLALQFRWAKLLSDALKKDERGVIARAREISAKKTKATAKDVLSLLIAEKGRGVERFNPPPVVFVIQGKKAVLSTTESGGARLDFEPGMLSENLRRTLSDLLESFAAQESTTLGGPQSSKS